MKKRFLFVILLLLPILVNAKEFCTIVSGTGTNIGDEIACGTEHFYVIENDGTNTKMLAKYNLYTGVDYYRTEEFTTTKTSDEYQAAKDEMSNKCNSLDEDYLYFRINENTNKTYNYFCYKYKEIKSTEVKQDKKAIGAHGDKSGKPEFPEYGVVIFDGDTEYPYATKPYPQEDEPFYNFKFGKWNEESGRYVKSDLSYLTNYQKTLNKQGIEPSNIDILTVDDIDNIVKKVSGKNLPLDDWIEKTWETKENTHPNHYDLYKVGSIKEKVDSKYSWLWSTTYWTKTMWVDYVGDDGYLNGYVYFIDTLGDLCSQINCSAAVGAGIRPVVTISNKDILYKVSTKTDGHGKIKVNVVETKAGTQVKFSIIPDEGYVLSVVKVTDENGNVLTFTNNEFTMPNANVLIEATFVKKINNPETKDLAIYMIIIIAIFSGLIFINSKKKISI